MSCDVIEHSHKVYKQRTGHYICVHVHTQVNMHVHEQIHVHPIQSTYMVKAGGTVAVNMNSIQLLTACSHWRC